jgi:hypothetical protein
MEKEIKPIEVQKELMAKKVEANFSHYTAGNLYYTVGLVDSVPMGTYQFPIRTVEPEFGLSTFILSEDLGTTTFSKQMKGSELNRWIKKAIENGDFVRVA